MGAYNAPLDPLAGSRGTPGCRRGKGSDDVVKNGEVKGKRRVGREKVGEGNSGGGPKSAPGYT